MHLLQLKPQEVHIWLADLNIGSKELAKRKNLLNIQELERADRLQQNQHKHRFIAARGQLKILLSRYLDLQPQKMELAYSDFGKPYLAYHPNLQFNLAHSHDLAIYAFTINQAIGVDIEYIRERAPMDVAKRYFNVQEIDDLNQLPEQDRISAFFRLWARKEAILKAIGKGLRVPLSSFNVSAHDQTEQITLENETWILHSLTIHPHYQAAVASNQIIDEIITRKC